jgi:acetyl-CoA synthetase
VTKVIASSPLCPEFLSIIAVFSGLKAGAIVGPLFADFGPDPVRDRLQDSGAKVLVTTPILRARIESILHQVPQLKFVIVVDRNKEHEFHSGEVNYIDAMSTASSQFADSIISAEDYSIIHYTSGTTGKPKGAVHKHHAAIQQYATGKWVLDFHENDVYWCTAIPDG